MNQIPPLTRAQLDIPKGVGVAVSYVAEDSPAEKAGLKANDIITKLDDQLIINAQQLQTLIESRKVGDETTITYYRKGKKQTTKAKLAKGAMVAQGSSYGARIANKLHDAFVVADGNDVVENEMVIDAGVAQNRIHYPEKLNHQLILPHVIARFEYASAALQRGRIVGSEAA